jgi:hypothetical protein
MRNCDLIEVEGTETGRRRPKIALVEVVTKDMSIKEVTKSVTLDRIEWWKRIYVVNPD